FDSGAIDAITSLTGGLPRLINLLCDRALMAGAMAETGTIDAAIVDEAGRVLAMTPTDAPARRARWAWHRVLWILAAFAVLVFGTLRVVAVQPVIVPPLPDAPPFAQGAGLQPRPV